MLTRERESSRRLHSGFERNPPGYDRTPNVTATNRERRPSRRNCRNPLRATSYRDHAARPRCGVAVNGIRPYLSRKPAQLPERNPGSNGSVVPASDRRRATPSLRRPSRPDPRHTAVAGLVADCSRAGVDYTPAPRRPLVRRVADCSRAGVDYTFWH